MAKARSIYPRSIGGEVFDETFRSADLGSMMTFATTGAFARYAGEVLPREIIEATLAGNPYIRAFCAEADGMIGFSALAMLLVAMEAEPEVPPSIRAAFAGIVAGWSHSRLEATKKFSDWNR